MNRMHNLGAAMCAVALAAAAPALAAGNAPKTGSNVTATTTPGATAPLDMTTLREVDDDENLTAPNGLRPDQLDDLDVVTADGERIGEVDEVLANAANEIVGVTVETGGFLGINERETVIGFDRLSLQNGKLVTTMSSDDLKKAPEWRR